MLQRELPLAVSSLHLDPWKCPWELFAETYFKGVG